ncbi:MAG: T9SS type A sorting domain-containing protein, partial [Bacteroidales bacterium]|nr:T9SS type A sorting domain-containing protein [Bacteroidales bacterium]
IVADASGNIGWKKEYSSPTPWNGPTDLEALPNGDLLLTGSAVFRADNSGQVYNSFAIEDPIGFSFIDVTQKTGGGFYAIGFYYTNNNFIRVQLIKLDQDFIEGWQIEIPALLTVNQVWSVGNDVYVTAQKDVGIKPRVVLLKFRDNGTSAAYQWTKYLELNETSPFGYWVNGFTAFLPPNKIVYANSRTRTNGYGFEDGFISVSDMDFNTCLTQMVSDNIVVKNNLFNSPVLPSNKVVAVPTPVVASSSSVPWSSSDACLTDCDCDFSKLQINGPNPGQIQPVVCGGAPVTLGCQPGTGYTLTGKWGQSCPTIRSVFVNACGTETANEFLIVFTGKNGLAISDLQIDFDGSVNIGGPENNDINTGPFPCGFQQGNPNMISGIQSVFPVSPIHIIPANSYLIIQTSASAQSGAVYDFSAYNLPNFIYVVRSTCSRSAEAFPNSGTGSVTTGISVAGSCSSSVTYNKALLTSNLNGDYLVAPSSYGNAGCTAPPPNLVILNSAVKFNWILSGPAPTQSGTYTGSGPNASINPNFSLSLLPSYFTQPGLYTLTLQGVCGDKICPCTIQFNVNCPDPCPCGPADLQAFQAKVDKGFATSFSNNNCEVCFSPLALNGCHTVEWQLSPFTGPPIGTSIGNQTFCHTFPWSGFYTVKMIVTQKKSDGTICEIFSKTQTVDVICTAMLPPADPLFKNSGFSQSPVTGGLNSGGSATGWTGSAGNPVLVSGAEGSQDGWSMFISGNASSADVLSSIETVCIPGTENGMLSLRLRVPTDPIPGADVKVGKKPPPPVKKLSIQFSSGTGSGCPAGNCYTVAVLEELFVSNDWYEVRIPYNLSNWTTAASCGKGSSSIPVRIHISVSNEFTDDQGDGYNRDYILIDHISLNNLSTSVEFPAIQAEAMRLYPNPASGAFTLELAQAPEKGAIIRIIKPSGQIVQEKKTQAGECIHNFDTVSMPAGLYFVQIFTNGYLKGVEKIIVQ